MLLDIRMDFKDKSSSLKTIVIGSLSILGLEADFSVPPDIAMSNDVGWFARDDPDRVFKLVGSMGENSACHERSEFYLDAVGPKLSSLPDGRQDRMMKVERPP